MRVELKVLHKERNDCHVRNGCPHARGASEMGGSVDPPETGWFVAPDMWPALGDDVLDSGEGKEETRSWPLPIGSLHSQREQKARASSGSKERRISNVQ